MAGVDNWSLEQGARFQRTLTYKTSGGNPIDLTGYSVRMDIRDKKNKDSSLIHDLSASSDITISNATGGEITIDIADEDTETFDWLGRAYYDVEIEDSSSNVTRLVQGFITLNGEVTG